MLYLSKYLISLYIILYLKLINVYSFKVEEVLNTACNKGDLKLAEEMSLEISSSLSLSSKYELAMTYHIRSGITYILDANAIKAVELHKIAKSYNNTMIPPLASLHLNGEICGGLGDIFYVTAVIIKSFVDSDIDIEKEYSGATTMITLCMDSGLPTASENHLLTAIRIKPNDPTLKIRSLLMTPAIYESNQHIEETRLLLSNRIQFLLNETSIITDANREKYILTKLDEFTLTPTFYYVYQGMNDKKLLTDLHQVYANTNSDINKIEIKSKKRKKKLNKDKKIKIGFVSSHFRRHSICKLFCGLIKEIDKNIFDVYVFSALNEKSEDEYTRSLIKSNGVKFIRIGMTLIHNRLEVTSRKIDVLVYLDIGMTPSTPAWASGRLAPIQITTWGHPTTTGMHSIDYFVSSDAYHVLPSNSIDQIKDIAITTNTMNNSLTNYHLYDSFLEQLIRIDSLGHYFKKPVIDIKIDSTQSMDDLLTMRPDIFYTLLQQSNIYSKDSSLVNLINLKQSGSKIILCPQFLPKLHPNFDYILKNLLERTPNSYLVLLGSYKIFYFYIINYFINYYIINYYYINYYIILL
jgi:hypothetical protein